jgi:hypothetical protein
MAQEENQTPDFENWTVEQLSEFIYGTSFSDRGVPSTLDFKAYLVDLAKCAHDYDISLAGAKGPDDEPQPA